MWLAVLALSGCATAEVREEPIPNRLMQVGGTEGNFKCAGSVWREEEGCTVSSSRWRETEGGLVTRESGRTRVDCGASSEVCGKPVACDCSTAYVK